jgi:tRNA-dihydrouridine synthase
VQIPVVGNGDVRSRADAERMVAQTGCDAVMVGRAALGNPWIFRELAGGPPPATEERRALVLRHFEEHVAQFRDADAAVRAFRKPLLWYSHGLRGASHFRVEAVRLEGPAAVRAAIDRYFAGAEPDPSFAGGLVEAEGPG